MPRTVRTILMVAAVGALVVAGVVAGVLTNRWGATEDDRVVMERLARIPTTVGPWVGTDDPKDDPTMQKMMKVVSAIDWLSREYRNRKTGERLTVLIMYGPAGPLADHTPDVCNTSQGFQLVGSRSRQAFDLPGGGTASLWSARYAKPGVSPIAYQVSWAWGTDGNWSASSDPHKEFVTRRAIFKLYVTRAVSAAAATAPNPTRAEEPRDPAREFLTDFLPEVKAALAPG